jgi:hypothetical protein
VEVARPDVQVERASGAAQLLRENPATRRATQPHRLFIPAGEPFGATVPTGQYQSIGREFVRRPDEMTEGFEKRRLCRLTATYVQP